MDWADSERYAHAHPIFYGGMPLDERVHAWLACGGSFIDVGAGDGAKIYELVRARTLARYDRLVAVDHSASRVRNLRERLPDVDAVVADAQSLPFDDETFDVLYCDQVIEHLPDDALAAREAYRVLKRGGRAVIGSVLKGRHAFYFYRVNGAWRLDPTHLREYGSVGEYRRLFEDAGFKVRDVFTIPLSYLLGDLVLRALLRLRFISTRSGIDAYRRWSWLRPLRALSFSIPGYSLIYALLER